MVTITSKESEAQDKSSVSYIVLSIVYLKILLTNSIVFNNKVAIVKINM